MLFTIGPKTKTEDMYDREDELANNTGKVSEGSKNLTFIVAGR